MREVYKQAVRFGNWKAVRNGKASPVELYDLSRDLGEKRDVAKQHPDVVKQVLQILTDARSASEDYPDL